MTETEFVKPFAVIREEYVEGRISLRRIRSKHHMSDGEMRDAFPEEFEDETPEPERGPCGY